MLCGNEGTLRTDVAHKLHKRTREPKCLAGNQGIVDIFTYVSADPGVQLTLKI